MKLELFSKDFGKKNPQISDFMKIHPVGAEVFHADRQTDYMTKLIVAIHKFAKAG